MLEILILAFIALSATLIAARRPASIFVALIVIAPYYGLTKQLLSADSLLIAWKDVLLAGLLAGVFLRLHGKLKCPAALAIFLGYCAVSACIPADWQIGLLGFRATCQWMLLAVAASSLRDASLAVKAGRALIASGTIVAAVYIVERVFFHTQDQIALNLGIRSEDRWRYNMVLERFSLIYGNPNAIAVFLVICVCFAFGWYLTSQSSKGRTLLLLCGGLCLSGVLFTASRGAIAALAVALLVIAFGASKKARRLVLVAALGLGAVLVQPEMLTRRLNDTTTQGFLSSYRYQAWIGTLDRAASSRQLLILGSGLGTYGGYVSDRAGLSDVITENQYLKVLGEQGAIGLLLLLMVVVRLRRRGAEIHTKSGTAVPAAIIAVLVYCLMGNILDGLVVAVPFWILVGIRLTALRRPVPVRVTVRNPTRRYSPPFSFPAVTPIYSPEQRQRG